MFVKLFFQIAIPPTSFSFILAKLGTHDIHASTEKTSEFDFNILKEFF